MIGKLQGIVDYIGEDFVILMAGPVGYKVYTPENLVKGANTTLWIETIVREDSIRLFGFLSNTQSEEMEKLGVFKSEQKKRAFLNRLQGELVKRGVIDVLRNGIKVYPADLIMFYLTPNKNNAKSKANFDKNIFSVTRQLRYSIDASKLALDMCVFINGLPVITFELKNQLTKQNVDDAVQQYKNDRSPKETLFTFKHCIVHFALDDARIKFCTRLADKNSWFLPFDKGYKDGTGNPPNPDGIMTDYLWKDILTRQKLAKIIENYAQVIEETDEDTVYVTNEKSTNTIFEIMSQIGNVTISGGENAYAPYAVTFNDDNKVVSVYSETKNILNQNAIISLDPGMYTVEYTSSYN